MRTSAEEKLENLKRRRAQLDAEVNRLEAKARVDRRKADTRRKILIGAVMLQEMEKRQDFDAWVRKLLGERLERPRDRALFGFATKAANDTGEGTSR